MLFRLEAVVVLLYLLLATAQAVASSVDVGAFELTGEVTEVDTDSDLFVVTVDGQDVVVACDADTRPGCAELVEGRTVTVKGHFGLVGEACSGRELFYNPLIVDDLWQCDGAVCEQL